MRKVLLFAGLVLALGALAVLLPGSARSDAGGTNLPFHGYFAGSTELNLLNLHVHIEGLVQTPT